jgi:hypothetical protein
MGWCDQVASTSDFEHGNGYGYRIGPCRHGLTAYNWMGNLNT